MNQGSLLSLKEKLSKLNSIEQYERKMYLRALSCGKLQGPLTGYASIDQPWLGHYPDMLFSNRKSYHKIADFLKATWTDMNDIMIHYYGTDISVGSFFERVSMIAQSLSAMGVKEHDSILSSLESVPEFIELLIACEMIGCSLKSYIGEIDDIIQLANDTDKNKNISLYFAPDYISQEAVDRLYQSTNIQHIIMVDPLCSVLDRGKIRNNILKEIQSRYCTMRSNDSRNMSFSAFLERGKEVSEISEVTSNHRLLSAFTSGSTNKPKEVCHSSESILGILNQMALFPSKEEKFSWILTILPPTLVAVVVAMMCYPLVDGKKLILDPYCRLEDLDLEMMHYEPNFWPLIPIFFNILLDSKRIPKDYDMSYFKLFGFGAEPMTQMFMQKVQSFLNAHHCNAPLSSGYGQSEGGSDFTIAMGIEMLLSGSAGIPLIDTTIAIFEPSSELELPYKQVGEICKSGPGIMISYGERSLNDGVLKLHSDGRLWLHTGDYGYMTDKGLLFVLGRKGISIHSGQMVFPLGIENKISFVNGIKEAIVVAGKDQEHIGFECPYLFIVPDKGVDKKQLLSNIQLVIEQELSMVERPNDIYFIEDKPVAKFKTDRKKLQKEYHLL